MAFEKTINLTGTEVCIEIKGKNCDVRNDSNSPLYVSRSANIVPDADDVLSIPPKQAAKYCGLMGVIYLLGTGKAQICGNNSNTQLFKCAAASSGEAAATGESISICDSVEYPLLGMTLYGKSTQDGTPTPETPVDIVSVGDDGAVSVTSCGKNILVQTCTTKTSNGVTFTPQADGSIIMNGTATGDVRYDIYIHNDTDILSFGEEYYTLSFGSDFAELVENYSDVVFMVLGYMTGETTKYIIFESTATKTFRNTQYENKWFVRVRLYAGAVCDNVRIYPQLEHGTTATAYEPYKGATATLTTALPLCSVGNSRDVSIFKADGKGKAVKKCAYLSATEDIGVSGYVKLGDYVRGIIGISSHPSTNTVTTSLCNVLPLQVSYENDTLHHYALKNAIYVFIPYAEIETKDNDGVKKWLIDKGAEFVYVLATPEEIDLTAEEVTALKSLMSYKGTTNVFNDEGAEMEIKYCNSPLLSECYLPIFERQNKEIEELKAAILSAGANI